MIEVRELTKVFHAQGAPVRVLDRVSLRVERGEVFGIIGRSGAGKSTLVRCMNALERPTSGSVHVDGREVSALEGAALRDARRHIGMIFQHFNLLASLTAAGNVALPLELAGRSRREIGEEVPRLLDLVGLAGKHGRYPSELSGGEKQRVGIARALASRPPVLLCDEATSALDPETTRATLALLRDLQRRLGLTIVLITHEMQVIQEICDRVAVLEHGRVVEEGRVYDVFTSPRAEVTRSFVRDVVDRALPAQLVERMRHGSEAGGRPVLRIVFTGPSAHHPVLAEVVRRFDVLLNIIEGHIAYIQEQPYGNLVVEAIGDEAAIARAVAYVRDQQLSVEVIGRVAGDARAVA